MRHTGFARRRGGRWRALRSVARATAAFDGDGGSRGIESGCVESVAGGKNNVGNVGDDGGSLIGGDSNREGGGGRDSCITGANVSRILINSTVLIAVL